jgi:hypothetical protein
LSKNRFLDEVLKKEGTVTRLGSKGGTVSKIKHISKDKTQFQILANVPGIDKPILYPRNGIKDQEKDLIQFHSYQSYKYVPRLPRLSTVPRCCTAPKIRHIPKAKAKAQN